MSERAGGDEPRGRPHTSRNRSDDADLREALELEDVIIVGNDSGGAIAPVLVTTRPDRVGRHMPAPASRTSDSNLPISCAERLAREAKNAVVHTIPDAKTSVPLDQPAILGKEIAQFAVSS